MTKRINFLSYPNANKVTGGNRYNQMLLQTLRNQEQLVYEVESLTEHTEQSPQSLLVVDSLSVPLLIESEALEGRDVLILYHMPPERMAPDLLQKPSRFARLTAFLSRSQIVVTGRRSAEHIAQRFPSAKKVTQIPAGINEVWQRKTCYRNRPQRLLFVASLLRGKGYERLLEALGNLDFNGWTLSIFGEDQLDQAYAESIKGRFRRDGFDTKIRWNRAVSQATLNRAMCDADLMLVSSDFESYSMVTAEAIAAGLPVLSTPVGEMEAFALSGLVRYVQDFEPVSFANALRLLLECPIAYQQIAHGAAKRRYRRPGWDEVADAFMRLVNK